MSSTQYDDAILDSNAIDPTDKNGNPIPVTIPIMLAPGIKVVYTTRLGGTSEGDFAHFNLGGKSGDKPEHVLANRKALADVLGAKISLSARCIPATRWTWTNHLSSTSRSDSTCPARRSRKMRRTAKTTRRGMTVSRPSSKPTAK